MSKLLNLVVIGSIAATVFFLLAATIILPQFNTAYNFSVTGLSVATTQGLLLLVLVLLLVGVGIQFMPRTGIR